MSSARESVACRCTIAPVLDYQMTDKGGEMMPTQYLRGPHVRADDDTSTSADPVCRVHRGVKRDGLEIRAESWDLENFRKNLVVLWSHDYWGNAFAD